MRVKICGIRDLKTALFAIEAGADALGFVFYEKSPRFITPLEALKITKNLPPFVERVGLFVNKTSKEIDEICLESGMSLAQIHFEVDSEFLDSLKVKSLPVVRAKTKEDVEKFGDRYRLIDAFVESYGGEGKRVEVDFFKDIDTSKIILAGGLNAKNLSEIKGLGF